MCWEKQIKMIRYTMYRFKKGRFIMMNRKWKIYSVMYFALVLFIFLPGQASAYIDPSTTTYIIQAVAGIAVAVGAFFLMYWRKAKRKIADKLHIDTDVNKEVEDDIQTDDEEK